MELKTDALLRNGTYRIVKKLGQGSFGITYLAEHTSLGKKLAIKEFFMKDINSRSDDGSITGLTDGSFSYNYAQKFKHEAKNLAKLEQPNIVRVTDCFDENNTYYYVMDFIEGENLNDYLKTHALSEDEAISIIKDVASALAYMHEQHHMLHLDLKPGNIMRRASDGHIYLIDFGLSKHYSNDGQPETSTTIGLGTQGYAPIEQGNQSKNGEFRPTIDVYALGATLYKLLTGETPPAASDVLADPNALVNKLNGKGISQSVVSLVMAAMEPVAIKRIPTIREFCTRLLSINSSQAIPQEPTTSNNISEETRIVENYNQPQPQQQIPPQPLQQIPPQPLRQVVPQVEPYNNATPEVEFEEQPTKKKKKWFLPVLITLIVISVVITVISLALSSNTNHRKSYESKSYESESYESNNSAKQASNNSPNIMEPNEFNNYITELNNNESILAAQQNRPPIKFLYNGNSNCFVIQVFNTSGQYLNSHWTQEDKQGLINYCKNTFNYRFLNTLRYKKCPINLAFYEFVNGGYIWLPNMSFFITPGEY